MHAGPAAAGGPTDAAGRKGLVDQVSNLVLGDNPAAAAPVAGAAGECLRRFLH